MSHPFTAQAFRIQPAMPPDAYKTFAISSPPRPATCEEVGCPNYLNGWKTILPAGQAPVVRELAGRYSFTEAPQEGGLVEFVFPAGQQCFLGRAGKHTLPWDGRERFFERGGDWRGNPRGDHREHTRADDWVDSFANHQDRLKTAIERG